MRTKCTAHASDGAADWLARHSSVPALQARELARITPALLAALPPGSGWLLGLAGAPGTGKSTLARMLAAVESRAGSDAVSHPSAPIVVLSLDDYYLTRAERDKLAQTIHPALAQRGVPGTHDQSRLFANIDQLVGGFQGNLAVPAFDKSRDDRKPGGRLLALDGQPARIIVEGWFIGTPPLPEKMRGQTPRETPSQNPDREHALHEYIASRHAAFYRAWCARADALWLLAAPDFDTVRDWRWQQEQDLPANRRLLKSPAEVQRFLQPFEALVRYQLACGEAWADLVLQLDRDHLPHLQCAP